MSNENFNDAAVEAAAEEAVAAEAVAEQVEEIAEEAAEVVAEGIETLEAESYRTETGEETVAVIERAPLVFDRPVQTVGRRKEAIARARLVAGTGQFIINGKRSLEEYFPNKLHQQLIKSPLVAVERTESFDIHVKVAGGGPSGQAGALRLAIARGLIEVSPEDRSTLKKAGFLTRDARAVERKKYGLKKARKASQYSKR